MGTQLPTPDNLATELRSIHQDIQRLATSPQSNFSTIKEGATRVLDGSNNERIVHGAYTFPAGPFVGVTIYAMVSLDPAGHPILVIGQQPDGTYGLGMYTTAGVRIVDLGVGGLTSYDAGEHPRTQVGLLANGDYGTAVYSPANDGTYQELRPYQHCIPGRADAGIEHLVRLRRADRNGNDRGVRWRLGPMLVSVRYHGRQPGRQGRARRGRQHRHHLLRGRAQRVRGDHDRAGHPIRC